MKFKIFFFTYLIFCFSETIKKFDVAIKVDEQRKTTIEETILYDSESLKRQGIIRFIPIKTKPPLKIKLLSVKDGNLVNHPYEVKNDGEFLTIKIGQAGKFFQGQNIYQITYECFNCWREFEDYLEFYWNVTGNDWDMWIEQSRAKIIFDKPTRVLQSVCFTGKRGSKEKDCQIRELENAVEIVSNRALSEGEGLTVAISVPKNVFKQPLIPESIKQFGTRNFLALALIVVGICLPLYAFFRILALGNRGAAIKVQDNPLIVQYEPPEGLLPLEAGHLINGRLNMEDIAGEIVNLATKGVIKITDTYREIPLLPDIPDVVLTRLTDDSSLDEAQKKLLNLFFGWKKEVSLYEASKNPGFGNRFRREFKDLERYLDKKMIKEGIFDQKKYSQLNNSRALVAFSFFITFFGVLIAGEDPPSLIVMGVAISVFLTIITLLFSFAKFWAFYTRKGLDVLEKLRGYKEFLKGTESEKLYIYTRGEDLSFLFERHLPFAIALGVGSAWAEKFKNLADLNLRWYSNTYKPKFSALDVNNCLRNIASRASEFGAKKKSGISGGFSGGGLGGGGGKTW